MVEATAKTDGIVRKIMYAKWRTDKPADPGYSQELVNINTPDEFLDNMDGLPAFKQPYDTIMGAFLHTLERKRNDPFMGTRERLPNGEFGGYKWQTWAEINEKYEAIAKGSIVLDLCPVIEGLDEDGKEWRFCGVWSKNRWEWHTTMLSTMVQRATLIGFYDSMGDASVDYCLNQTKLSTIFATNNYLPKVTGMKQKGQAQYIKNMVLYDGISNEKEKTEAEA